MKNKTFLATFILASFQAHAGVGDWFASKTTNLGNQAINYTTGSITDAVRSSVNGSISLPGAYTVQPGTITPSGNGAVDNCKMLQADLVNQQQAAINARIPTTTPGYYVNDVYKVNDTLAQKIDVSSLFSGGFNLSGIFDSMSNSFIKGAVNSGQSFIGSRIRSIAGGYGASFGGYSGLSAINMGSAPVSISSANNTQPLATQPTAPVNPIYQIMQSNEKAATLPAPSNPNFFAR